MSRIHVPSVRIIHYVDPICPWSLGLERTIRDLRQTFGERLEVEYRVGVAVPDIEKWMNENGFNYESLIQFHVAVGKKTKVDFDPDFVRKTGLKSSLPGCLAFKAAQLYNDKLAREYLQRMMYEFLIKAQQINEDAIVKIAGDLGFDRTKLSHDMNSKRVGEAVKRDVGAMERDQATFLDLIVITPDGNSERISDAFEAKSVARVIERMVPGLPRSI